MRSPKLPNNFGESGQVAKKLRRQSAKLLYASANLALASKLCPGGGMVYAQHLKCCGLMTMWVRVPPRAQKNSPKGCFLFFTIVKDSNYPSKISM